MALVESAEIAGFKEKNIVGALLGRIKSSKIPIELKSESYGNSEELLKRAQVDDSNRSVWLLIDDIDSAYVDTDDQKALVSTFFSACRAIVREVDNLYIRVTVRTDVWMNFTKNQDLDKSEQYITDIQWSAKELERVLAKKIYAYIDRNFPDQSVKIAPVLQYSPQRILDYAFRHKVQWGKSLVPPFRPIQILSSGRPRWMSQLCRLAGQQAAKSQQDVIGIQDINFVLNKYTRYRLDDLNKEHAHQFSDLERLINTFANKQARYPTDRLIKTLINDYANIIGGNNIPLIDGYPYKGPIQLAHFLFKIGFIAARREHVGHSEYAEFVRHEERPELLTDNRNLDDGLQWGIYPSYRDALGIKSAGRAARDARRQQPGSKPVMANSRRP